MNKKRTSYKNIVLISQLSISVMVPMFLCLFLGKCLDRLLGTGFLIIIFLVLGILAGGRNAYVLALDTVKQEEIQRKKEQERKIQEVLKKANVKKSDIQN